MNSSVDKVVFFDLVGTIYSGSSLYGDVIASIKKMKENGYKIGFISNSSLISNTMKEKIFKLFKEDKYLIEDSVFCTSGDVFINSIINGKLLKYLRKPKNNNFLYRQIGASNGLMDSLNYSIKFEKVENDVGFENIDFVLVSGETTQDDINNLDSDIEKYLKFDIPFLCPNPDISTGDPKNGQPCKFVSGYFAKTYENAGGRSYYTGKPYSDIFQLAASKGGLAIDKNTKIFMIGDNILTDVDGIINFRKVSLFPENLFSVLLKRGLYNEDNDNSKADFIASDISEAFDFISSI